MSEERFDAIVIGAGPAGIACAYKLAQEGREVLVIERADQPGAKNLTGGRFYTYALEMVAEGLTAEAELERKVSHEQIMIISGPRAVCVEYIDPSFVSGEVPQSYTILRASFDRWFASKAEEMGAMIVGGIKVDDLIEKNGRIVGVIAGEDEMYADVVIAADGVNSLIARKAGLRGEIASQSVGIGVKEVIELPPEVIEQRFNLATGEGVARMILGCTEGIHGGGFLYTNRDSISLGAVFMPEEVAAHRHSVHEIFQHLKMHPAIYPLIEGGTTVEYGGHLVSEDGYDGILKRPYREGLLVVGDAAGFVINTGSSIRGIDLAILSGLAAAEALLATSNPALAGSEYMKALERLQVLPTMKTVRGYRDLLNIERLYGPYPDFAADVMQGMYRVDGKVPPKMKKIITTALKQNKLSLWNLIKDGLKGVRSA
ncbi:MAG TPA: FAD-dependent oxidoreductase [Syntrophomonadaceae bacterium]|nr:FAD-dependent oxidoreductase [Syntrophomonadaceae bacterium]HQA07920.1 FAD-dependent oxidoreductase [Syntrophomonadaceae bacterium]HQE22942.1 FAD-dependent oxidoreductase [Syntrophomonadaceae bacterium]